MQQDDFCLQFQKPTAKTTGSRRQSTSWDNDLKVLELNVPPSGDRRNSHTLAQLLECSRQLSSKSEDEIMSENNNDNEDILLNIPQIGGSRRASIAELADNGITMDSSDDCVVITQTLGTSKTYFFQKDPSARNLFLRPSAVERGIFNFDEMIKEVPKSRALDTPRPSIQLHEPCKPAFNIGTCVAIVENADENEIESEKVNTDSNSSLNVVTGNNLSRRPSRAERGLPVMKFPTATFGKEIVNSQEPGRGRTLQKNTRGNYPLNCELDEIIAQRRKLIDREAELRESLNLIPQRSRSGHKTVVTRPHCFDGRAANPTITGIMDELRTQIDAGEVDRIVKEKKTTTVTETREIVYFTHRLPSTIAIATRLSPTGVPYNSNRKSITSEQSVPPILDRPYIRATTEGKQPFNEANVPVKTVTTMIGKPQEYATVRRTSNTPPPNNVRLLSSDEKMALRRQASKFDQRIEHPIEDIANNCRPS